MIKISLNADNKVLSELAAVVAWLKDILEEQKSSRNRFKKDFDVVNHLSFVETLPYDRLVLSEIECRRLASVLFHYPEDQIFFRRKYRQITQYCLKISFEFGEKQEVFYLKKAWEGSVKEAIGIELNNLLTDTPIRYLCNHEIVVTENIFEPLFPETVYRLRKTTEYAFAYGKWEVFTRILRLTDRKIGNVRWNGESLANIDFGLVFYRGEPVFDSRLALFENDVLYREGKIYALKFILNRINEHKNKIKEILLNMDSVFCRNLPCHRSPLTPLRCLLGELNAILLQNTDTTI